MLHTPGALDRHKVINSPQDEFSVTPGEAARLGRQQDNIQKKI